MPNVNDIANIAEALERQHVLVIGDRCVAVRNRNATCRKCVNSCPWSAITVEANEIRLDASSCVGCGSCIEVCPTEALISVDATDGAIDNALEAASAQAGGRGVIACARISSKRLADPSMYAEVPCLGRIGESSLMTAASNRVSGVILVDGNCQTCKHRDCMKSLDEAIDQVKSALATSGAGLPIERRSEFPEELLVEDSTGMFGSTRRGFFTDAVSAARDTAKVAARTTLEQELGLKADEVAIGERLRVTSAGSLPTVKTPRHDAFLDAFDALGEPVGEYLYSRKFATVEIDVDRCNSCGMCAVFCPTGALRRNPCEKASDPIEYIEFCAAECVNCRLCDDVCWKDALTYREGVSIAQLYDFEPVVFNLPRQGKSSLFGASRL